MAVYKSVMKYASVTHGQPNNNTYYAPQRIDWDYPDNASSRDNVTKPQGKSYSYYVSKTSKIGKKTIKLVQKPWTFTAHGFGLNGADIPDCAFINKITFKVAMETSGDISVKAPYARFNIYRGTKSVDTYREDDTGWDDGYWYYNPNKKLSNTLTAYEYVMSGAEFRKRGYPISSLRESVMGIDLRFYDSVKQESRNAIKIKWVSCQVDYELPDHIITFDRVTSINNPRWVNVGEDYRFIVNYQNRSNASCCENVNYEKHIDVNLPPNAVVTSVNNGNYNNGVWTISCTANASATLDLTIKNISIGENKINLNGDIGNYDYWIYTSPVRNDVGVVSPHPNLMQKGVESCIDYVATLNASDGEAIFTVNVDTVNSTNPTLTWSLLEDSTGGHIQIEEEQTNDTQLVLNVPRNETVIVKFRSCFIPTFYGDNICSVQLDNNLPVTAPYFCKNAPTFVIRNETSSTSDDRSVMEFQLTPSKINFTTHRVATTTELDAYVIDCGIAPFDANMKTDDCTLTASIWERLDYIGMIPLEFHHYDPKSTFENKAISESYKNKTYKGKEGIIDENISLHFKVRPPQATTLQGLVEFDKPTPINASHKCFEGDVLNHRGWVVLSKVEIEKTNPLWYDVDATVDYITHDINTKFQIYKGLPIDPVSLPSMLSEEVGLGDNLSECLNYFNIDTDGGFVYDDDGEDGAKNIFSLDNEQHLSITTKNPLTPVCNIRFEWYSNHIDENRENNMERVFSLKNKNGEDIFQYEYSNFQFEDDRVNCTAIIRYKNNTGGWAEPITIPNLDLKTEIEADLLGDETVSEVALTEDESIYDELLDDHGDTIIWIGVATTALLEGTTYSGRDIFKYLDGIGYSYPAPTEGQTIKILLESYDDDESDGYEEGYIAPSFDPSEYDVTQLYGSSLQLELNGNKLEIIDEGYSGREVYRQILLVDGEYTFATNWINHNRDGTTEDIISYIDMSLEETVLDTQYTSQYQNLVVSPFPIPKKKVVFTRESEEGTIYYLTGEEPFKYMLEPFYQYYCGTDLVTREGISLFNLNNSHTYFYIENGLVRLGFNKFSGALYLAKYDLTSKSYVTTTYLHMKNDVKFSLAKYSDDEITIKAGNDTYFTIFRGHPYIKIKNTSESIYIDSLFNYCYSDLVEGRAYEYPLIHSFMNTDNLLPVCLGGKSLNPNCITIDDEADTPQTHTVTLNNLGAITGLTDVTLGVTISPSVTTGKVHYLVDGKDIGSASYPFRKTTDAFKLAKTYTIQAIYVDDDSDSFGISDEISIIVKPPEPAPDTKADNGTPYSSTVTGKYKLTMVHAPSKFTYKDYLLNPNQQVVLQLTRGGTVMPNMVVELQLPTGHTVSKYTDGEGKVYIPNNSVDYIPDTYQWGGRFYDDWDSTGNVTGSVIYKALKFITIEKATPTFTNNSVGGKISKGKDLVIKLNGIDRQAGLTDIGLADKKITYTVNGGSKKTKTTNKKGNIHIACNTKETKKITLYFAGSVRYKEVKETFTIKVV